MASPAKPKAKKPAPRKKQLEITESLEEPTQCPICKKVYPRQKTFFNPAYSPMFKNNNDFIPVCKSCVDNLLKEFIETYGNHIDAFRRVCQMFDFYFSEDIYTSAKNNKGISYLMGGYSSRMNGIQYNRLGTQIPKTYSDTVIEEREAAAAKALEDERIAKEKEEVSKNPTLALDTIEDFDDISENKEIKIKPETIKFWGFGFESLEYEMLEDEYSSWVIRANNGETPSIKLESVLKSVCVTSIDIKRARAAGGKASEITSLQNMRMKLLEKAGFSPDQEDTDNIAEKNALGVLIDVWEKTEPIPKYPEENKIKKYIKVWFKGHLAKSANLKNDTEDEYKAEIDKYKIKILEDEPVYEIPPVTIEDGEENV